MKPTARRAFIKKSVLTVLAGASVTDTHAKPQGRRVRRGQACSEKMGEIEPQPDKSSFTLERRMPGWRADTQQNQGIKFFPEEVLKKAPGPGGALEYFPVPTAPEEGVMRRLIDFKEPSSQKPTDASKVEQWYQDWQEFQKWILGFPLNSASTEPFDKLLLELARRIRIYNAALYLLRRLHFHENAPAGSAPLPRNPDADPDDPTKPLPDRESDDFALLVLKAEREWRRAVDDLNEILAGDGSSTYGFKHTRADMLEVNGYIVSMRVVSQPNPFLKEIGGSSSSHISISSAFSSPR